LIAIARIDTRSRAALTRLEALEAHMASNHESFWALNSFAFIGHSAVAPFPQLSYRAAKKLGKKVFAVDPSAPAIDHDKCYAKLAELPEKVDGIVIEVPAHETIQWIEQAAVAGIQDVWIHMNRDTPGALDLAKQKGMNVRTGTCAVMYLSKGFSPHMIHGWIQKLRGKF
jgi:predicted CoA-binding protein